MKRELDTLITQMHSSGIGYNEAVRQFKKRYILEVLAHHRGNQCKAAEELGMHRKVQLIVSGGIRNGADVAKALALGADAVSIGTAALIALGDNDPKWESEYKKLGTTAGAYDDWHEGRDPAGITTQDAN